MDLPRRRYMLWTVLALLALLAALPAHAQPRRGSELPPGSPLPPYLAWTVSADGAAYLLDARYILWELEPATLTPVRASAPLLPALGRDPAYLAVAGNRIWVAAAAFEGAKLLDRATLAVVGEVDNFGPLAAGPDDEIYMIDDTALYRFSSGAPDPAPEILIAPWAPEQYWGTVPVKLAVDAVGRRLFLTQYHATGSPPHNGESLLVSAIDPIDFAVIDSSLGHYSQPALTADGATLAVAFNAKSGALGSWVGVWQAGELTQQVRLLDGQVALDPAGDWLYLLNDRGLWVFGLPGMGLVSVLPLLGELPEALAVAVDGKTIYLFGRNTLSAIPATELHSLGGATLTALPDPVSGAGYRRFDAPDAAGVSFAVRADPPGPDPYGLLVSTDGQRTWTPNIALSYPTFIGVDGLSISPAFAADGTVVATGRYTNTLYRSTDGGALWAPWTPPIAFTAASDGQRDIVMMDMDSRAQHPVTNDAADDENPAWSPGWTELAFQSNRSGNWDIYAIRAGCDVAALGEAACGLRRLTDDPADDLLPAWSPDGRQIAFVSLRAGNADIYVLTLADGSLRQLTDDPAGDWRPAWLPDSRRLVFTSARNGANDLFAVRVPAAYDKFLPRAQPLIATPADERDATISLQDGLAFVSDHDGAPAIYTVGADAVWYSGYDDLAIREAIDAYSRFAVTAPISGTHPAWYPAGGSGLLLFARAADGAYSVALGGVYSVAETVVTGSDFVGHPAGGPVFWRGERVR